MQKWFSKSDLEMQEALFDMPLYREFPQPDTHEHLPGASTILRLRHRLECYKLVDHILQCFTSYSVPKS